MRARRTRIWSLMLAAAIVAWAHAPRPAQAEPMEVARQLAGLFLQGCLPFAGDKAGLRAWAARSNLSAVPEQARAMFLLGAPGQVFDASTTEGKFVLVSSDDGLCSSITDQARGRDVADALESFLKGAGIEFRLAIDRDDRLVAGIHFREYLAKANGRVWRILAATVKDSKGGRAMLTAAPG